MNFCNYYVFYNFFELIQNAKVKIKNYNAKFKIILFYIS
jgi:hypothetical protein